MSHLQAEYIDVMNIAQDIKFRHQKYARVYARERNNRILLNIVNDNWGGVPSYLYEHVNGTPSTNKKLLLANMIAERYLIKRYEGDLKHLSVSLVGLAGSGKTTYAIRSGIGALMLVGYDMDTAVEMTSRLTFFEPESLVKFMKDLVREKKWIPFLIVDDIGSQISKYWVHLGQHYWSYLFSLLDQMKDITGMLITTARQFTSIPNRVREITDLVAEFTEISIEMQVVDRIEYYKLADYVSSSKKKIDRMLFLDAIPPTAKMPNKLWNAMMESRRKVGLKRLEEIEKLMKLSNERLEKKMKELEEKMSKREVEEGGTDGSRNG